MSPLTGKPEHLNPHSGPFSYTCPHLGMLDDPSTVTLFASDANYCAYCRQPAVPNYEHQTTYCLNQNYVKCPLKMGTAPDRMPAKMRWNRYAGFNRSATGHVEDVRGIVLVRAVAPVDVQRTRIGRHQSPGITYVDDRVGTSAARCTRGKVGPRVVRAARNIQQRGSRAVPDQGPGGGAHRPHRPRPRPRAWRCAP